MDTILLALMTKLFLYPYRTKSWVDLMVRVLPLSMRISSSIPPSSLAGQSTLITSPRSISLTEFTSPKYSSMSSHSDLEDKRTRERRVVTLYVPQVQHTSCGVYGNKLLRFFREIEKGVSPKTHTNKTLARAQAKQAEAQSRQRK